MLLGTVVLRSTTRSELVGRLGTRERCHSSVVVVRTEDQVPARWRRGPKGVDVHREDGVVIQVPGEGATQVSGTGVRRRRRLSSPDASGCNVVTGWVRRISSISACCNLSHGCMQT